MTTYEKLLQNTEFKNKVKGFLRAGHGEQMKKALNITSIKDVPEEQQEEIKTLVRRFTIAVINKDMTVQEACEAMQAEYNK